MKTHEHDLLEGVRARPTKRREDPSVDRAAKALASGSTKGLDTPSVLHLQRAAGNGSVSSLMEEQEDHSPVKEVVGKGGGEPIPEATRGAMEQSMGHDFGDVRIHADSKASESAKSVSAQAYTVGSDIAFQSDKYQPDSPEGQKMLAHELTHVVQQREGPVAGTPQAGGVKVSDPSDQFEQAAERNAEKVMSGQASETSVAGGGAGSVQRQEGAEEEQEQQLREPGAPPVQRQEGAEEEQEQQLREEGAPPVQRQEGAEEEQEQQLREEGAPPVQRASEIEDEEKKTA